MSHKFYFDVDLIAPTNSNPEVYYRDNEDNKELFKDSKPGVYSLPYLFEKFLDNDYSRLFAEPKINHNLNFMKRGFYPNNLMSDISKGELHYIKLNEMFKLD